MLEFLARVAQEVEEVVVGIEDAAILPGEEDADDVCVDQVLEVAERDPERLLGGFARAYVSDGRCDQDPFGAFEWAQHYLDRKLGAVLAPPKELDPHAYLLQEGVGRGA